METLLLEFSLLGKSDIEQKLLKLTIDSESQEIKLQDVDNIACALARELRQGNQARPAAELIRNQLNQLDSSKPVKGLKTLLVSHMILSKTSPCISQCLSQVTWNTWEARAAVTGGKQAALNNQKLARDGVFRALLAKYWNFLAARVKLELKQTPTNSLQVLKKSIEIIRELDASLNGSLNKRLWLGLIAQQISNDVASNSQYLSTTIAGLAKQYLTLSLDQFQIFYNDYCDLIAVSKKIQFFQSLAVLYPMLEFQPITIFKLDGERNKAIELYHLETKYMKTSEKLDEKHRINLAKNGQKEDDRETILTSGDEEEEGEQEEKEENKESKESAKKNNDRVFLEQVDGFFNIQAQWKNKLNTDQSFNPMKQLQSIDERYCQTMEDNKKSSQHHHHNTNISQQSKEIVFKQVFIMDRQPQHHHHHHHLENGDCIVDIKEEETKGGQEFPADHDYQHASHSSSQSASGELSQTKSALMTLGNAPGNCVTLPYENEGQLERLL